MPELPEVETTLRGIAQHLEHKQIQTVIVRQPNLRWPMPDRLDTLIVGQQIQKISRRAKYLLFQLDSGVLLIHLGMSGSLRIVTAGTVPRKHDHLDIGINQQVVLRYHDPRRFGCVLWGQDNINEHKLIKDLGLEPLSEEFDGTYLYKLSHKRQTPVKSFIMNSHIVVGVGNIYANEALFLAGIHPNRLAGKISLERYQQLAESIKTVLQRAINQGGTTLRDFVNESGNPGYFKQELKVYGRTGLPCLQCNQSLAEIRLSNRSTVFCKTCQT